MSCTPLLLCNGIVLLHFAVRGIYTTILLVQKKVCIPVCIHKCSVIKLIIHLQPLPKQKGIDHCLGYVKRLLRGLGLAVICMILLTLPTCLSSQAGLTNSTSKYCYKWDPCKCVINQL